MGISKLLLNSVFTKLRGIILLMHPIGLVAKFKPFVSDAREGKGFFF